jgi:thiosulfate dehydrogenase [quinone] large subunit
MAKTITRGTVIQDPPIATFLFSNTLMSWFWLIVRVWVGYKWIDAAAHKVTDPAWVQTGAALKGFWERAVIIPEKGRPAITFDWYRDFIQYLLSTESYTWFAKLVAYGELLIGVALVVGAFVGIAAFFGALMNWNFLMAGTVSTNPVLLMLGIFLILAWKIAGYYGLDRYLLPVMGTPWQPGRVFEQARPPQPARA